MSCPRVTWQKHLSPSKIRNFTLGWKSAWVVRVTLRLVGIVVLRSWEGTSAKDRLRWGQHGPVDKCGTAKLGQPNKIRQQDLQNKEEWTWLHTWYNTRQLCTRLALDAEHDTTIPLFNVQLYWPLPSNDYACHRTIGRFKSDGQRGDIQPQVMQPVPVLNTVTDAEILLAKRGYSIPVRNVQVLFFLTASCVMWIAAWPATFDQLQICMFSFPSEHRKNHWMHLDAHN